MSWRTSAFVPRVEFMAPSSIHYIYADSTSARTSTEFRLSEPDLDRTVAELTSSAGGLIQARHLKIQIVEKDGNWFALNSSQLELCRRLEKGGVCPKVRVDIVPSDEVPLNVRDLMTLPVTCTSGDEKRTQNTPITQKNVKSLSAASATSGGGGGGGTAMKGYQQLGQEEKETEDDDEDEQEEEQEEEEDESFSEECEEEAFGDTDDGSSADIVSDSDPEWSDEEEVESSGGEWSNIDGHSSGSCSQTAELSSDDENNCLL